MKIKHSKYKNTGLIFELLVKQIAAIEVSTQDAEGVVVIKGQATARLD